MNFANVADYDDMPVFVACDLDSFFSAAERGDVRKGLSMALVLGDSTSRDVVKRFADIAVKQAPTLVHCFGSTSEFAHDSIDAAIRRYRKDGIQTYWSVDYEAADVIFEFFCTDLPAERDLQRWSGRLLILDKSLPAFTRKAILHGLRDIKTTIQAAVRGDAQDQPCRNHA